MGLSYTQWLLEHTDFTGHNHQVTAGNFQNTDITISSAFIKAILKKAVT